MVANSEGKLRLVLNLRHLNQLLQRTGLNMRTYVWVALLMFQKDDFLSSFDIAMHMSPTKDTYVLVGR